MYCKQVTYETADATADCDATQSFDCYASVEYAQVWGGMFSKRH
jgi:hypothetical protein